MKRLLALLLMAFTILSPLRPTECQVKETFGTSNLSYQHSAIYEIDSLIANKLHCQINALSNLWKGFRSFGSDPEPETTLSFRFNGQFVKSGGSNNDKINRSMGYGSQIYLPDTVVVRGVDVPVRYSFSYNADGRIISELIEKWQNSQWVDSLLQTWTYDPNERESAQLNKVWQDSSGWVNSILGSYSYDIEGNLTTVLSEKWEKDQWVNSSSSIYTYDSKGNALSSVLEDWEDSQWVKVYGEEYTYDASGNILTDLHELYDSTQAVYYSWQASYTYNAKGNLLTEFDQEIQSPIPINTCTTFATYSYDSTGHELRELWSDCGDSVLHSYTYDVNGNQTSETVEGEEGFSSWSLWAHDTSIYSYDPQGDLILFEYQESGDIGELYGSSDHISFNRVGNFYGFYGDTISFSWEPIQIHSVYVSSFTTHASLDSVVLSWNTLYEENTRGFNLLRKAPSENGFSTLTSSLVGKTQHVPGINESAKEYFFVDSKLEGAGTYSYKLQAINNDGSTSDLTTIQVNVEAPSEYALYQNYPNPFNPSTTITFDLNRTSIVTLDIYNVLGQKVAVWNYGAMNPGRYNEVINMSRYASGVYFYRLVAENFVQTKKLMLMK